MRIKCDINGIDMKLEWFDSQWLQWVQSNGCERCKGDHDWLSSDGEH